MQQLQPKQQHTNIISFKLIQCVLPLHVSQQSHRLPLAQPNQSIDRSFKSCWNETRTAADAAWAASRSRSSWSCARCAAAYDNNNPNQNRCEKQNKKELDRLDARRPIVRHVAQSLGQRQAQPFVITITIELQFFKKKLISYFLCSFSYFCCYFF